VTWHPTERKREELKLRYEWMMELYAMGLSFKEIAEKVDRTPQRVSQVVRHFGSARDRTRAQKRREEALGI
jgi:DNA-binding NarL/FixJ family response regulator